MFGHLSHKRGKGQCNDPNILTERGIVGVLDVQINHLFKGGAVFAADLPESSKPREGIATLPVTGFVHVVLVSGAGAGTDDAHFTFEHID